MDVINQAEGLNWKLFNADSTEALERLPDNSVDLSVFSPPFQLLYTYSSSDRDLGNAKTVELFWEHYQFIIEELLRVTKPGRNCCVHVAQIATTKAHHGVIGLQDFRGDNIRAYLNSGWIYHGEVCIDKDPQAQAIRTHSKALLFVQKSKDSSWLRPALADYILVFRKDGENLVPVTPDITNNEWVEWARPIWYGIRETDTLNAVEARTEEDERHICLGRGSLVLTREEGYIPIEEVEPGDHVLTHIGRWMPVIGKRCNGVRKTIGVRAQGVANLRLTPDHELWARDGFRGRRSDLSTSYLVGHSKRRAKEVAPQWIPAIETVGAYLNLKLPPVEDSPLTEEEWWLVGRWLGDGHYHNRPEREHGSRDSLGRRWPPKRGGKGNFIVSCSFEESYDLIKKIEECVGCFGHVVETRCAVQIVLAGLRPEVRDVLSQCGKGASGKHLPPEAFVLNQEKSEALLCGYLSADGYYLKDRNRWMGSSVSRSLLLGMAMVAQRARGVAMSVYAGRPDRIGMIEGRTVKMRQDWIFGFNNSSDDGVGVSGWVQYDGAWKKVKKLEESREEEVWDIEVLEDASFTAEGAVVKNCPLQLPTIERCIRLWSNPGEIVLSPFAGIGSEIYQAILLGRKGLGIELKPEYFQTAVLNCQRAENTLAQKSLFSAQDL